MKLLLLGKDGQVGEALQRSLASLGQLVACGRGEADLEQPGELPRLIAAEAPDVIVNAAAYTAVDRAESEPERARLVNCEAMATIAAAAKRSGAWLIHYSTDYVYDGRKPGPYVETDEANPLNVYGATKQRGDVAIEESGCRHLIFRVSWVYAAGHANFPATMLRLAGERDRLEVVADQHGAPTSAGLVARVTAQAVQRIAAGDAVTSGVYHLAAAGAVSRADLARFIVTEANARGAALRAAPAAIADRSSGDFPQAVARPLNSRLDASKLRDAFGVDLPPWQDDIRAFVADSIGAAR